MKDAEILCNILNDVPLNTESKRTHELSSLHKDLCALLGKGLDDEQKKLFSCICDVAENLAALKFDDGAAFGIYAAQHTDMPVIDPQAALESLNDNALPVSEAFSEAKELISGHDASAKPADRGSKKSAKKLIRWKNITL